MQTVMDLFLDSGVKQMIICNKTNNAMLPIVCQSPITCRIINEYSWLPDKEEEVIAVNAPVWLEEEVSDKQISPVGRVPAAREPGVLTTNQRSVLRLHGPIRGQYSIDFVPGPARGCKMVSSVNL